MGYYIHDSTFCFFFLLKSASVWSDCRSDDKGPYLMTNFFQSPFQHRNIDDGIKPLVYILSKYVKLTSNLLRLVQLIN